MHVIVRQKALTLKWMLRAGSRDARGAVSSRSLGKGILTWPVWILKTMIKSEILPRVSRSCHPNFDVMFVTLLVL